MCVFEKDPANPLRDGKEKHVVTEGGRPIRHRKTNAFARDHSSAADEEQGENGEQPGKATQPLVRLRRGARCAQHGFTALPASESLADYSAALLRCSASGCSTDRLLWARRAA